MLKILHLKGALAVVFVLIIVSVGYAGWRNLDNSSKLKNPDDTLTEPVTTSNSKTNEIDTSGWKIFRHDVYGIEIKYPPYYYAIPATENFVWLNKRSVFSLVLSEISPEDGAKSNVYPNIIINVFQKVTTNDFLILLHRDYGDITQKEVTVGEHNALLLEWTQEFWGNKPIKDQRLFIKSQKFLYVINADDFNSPLTQSTLSRVLLYLKLLP